MTRTRLTEEDIEAFGPAEKIGLVATLGETGEPHVTLLSTLMGRGPEGLALGEFSVGASKRNLRRDGRAAFLVMGLDRRLWRGTATWRGSAKEGPEYEELNRKPMFRYNTYFGINTVHYFDLREVEGPEPLPLAGIVAATLATALRARSRSLRSETPALSAYARGLVDALASLSFAAYAAADGYPRLVPLVQARTAGPGRLAFTPGPYAADLAAIPDGARVALFTMNLSMESVLVRGDYRAPGAAARGLGLVDVDWVYNSMPPCHGQVYPRPELEPVRRF